MWPGIWSQIYGWPHYGGLRRLTSGASHITLDITGITNSSLLHITDVSAGTALVICYLRGTRIRTASGEKPIETLHLGDMLVTRFGGLRPVKWIGEQSFDARFVMNNFDKLPVKIAAGALGENVPTRDLYVSPGHSILLGDVLVLAKNLVNGVSITQPTRDADIHYHLIEFDTHDCVLAEGCWAQSFVDGPGLCKQFHNVASFHALYPDYMTPTALQLCAPRPEAGPALEVALRPILARVSAVPGRLKGVIDIIGPNCIEGWACDDANPHLPVALEIFVGDEKLGDALACHYRADLAAAGLGRGYCMFSFSPGAPHGPIGVRRVADSAEIFPGRGVRAAYG